MGWKKQLLARKELCALMFGSPLFHTFLGASVSNVATASDASSTGGAVGRSDGLSSQGFDFCRALGAGQCWLRPSSYSGSVTFQRDRRGISCLRSRGC